MTVELYEVVLPRRVLPQPTPPLSHGGDCSACVLGGLLKISVQEAYTRFPSKRHESPSRLELLRALHDELRKGSIDRLVETVPLWNAPSYYLAFGNAGHLSFPEWFHYLRMAVDAGYYGIASVVFGKSGDAGKIPPETDHAVLLCGVREVRIPLEHAPGASKIESQVLVSCSARSSPDLEWVSTHEFLAQRGGYNVVLVRPA